jgi:hypothetical protein
MEASSQSCSTAHTAERPQITCLRMQQYALRARGSLEAASHPQTGVHRDEAGRQFRRRKEIGCAIHNLYQRHAKDRASVNGLRVDLYGDSSIIRDGRRRSWRMLAGVRPRATCTVAHRAAAAVGVMMTAHLNAVVLAAGRRMSNDRRRHHAYRRYGDQQTTERFGERFHGTTNLRWDADVVQSRQIRCHNSSC